MNNYKLLKQYKRKLSIYFALFILLSIWVVAWAFELSKYFALVNKDESSLVNKNKQIINVINNKDLYKDVKEITFTKVLNQIFKDSIIMSEWSVIISKIDDFKYLKLLKINTFINIDWYKYYLNHLLSDWINYKIITRKEIKYSHNDLLYEYLYLIIFSIPFAIIFYFLGLFFVWKNLKPIKENIKNLEDFTWNINHEFKTPLAEILSSLKLAKKIWNYEELVDQSITSANKINNILDSLMWLIDITDSSYKKQRTNIVSSVNKIITSYWKQAKKKNLDIIFDSSFPIIVRKINLGHFEICISNILSNSIKYSKENKQILIKLCKNSLIIQDFWEGIWKRNLKNIFKRYFRESYIKSGSWVWLSLVKKICDVNKWKISIKSQKNKWTSVKIIF